ncbi:MAG: metal-dependent transcriptional regulator [Chloroflexota bacterium]|jgi:DtxR family Mn-dependent transcriptional regulator
MSESEEMYLVTVANANEDGLDPVPLGHLAAALGVQPVSVNQMIKKLEENGKVVYTPYKGVSLTLAGKGEAARILRHRRLWEVFLAEQLGFSPSEADEIACRLEHVVKDDVMERLSSFLGTPQTSPQGKPIPAAASLQTAEPDLDAPLSMSAAGARVIVTAIKSGEATRNFLRQTGLLLGASLTVLAMQSTGVCLVRPDGHPPIQLAADIAHDLRVRPLE